jgi:hypothetical protein
LPEGCPIGDCAPDRTLNDQVEAFVHAEMLEFASPGYADLTRRTLEDHAILDETPQTILAAKAIVAKYRKEQMEK